MSYNPANNNKDGQHCWWCNKRILKKAVSKRPLWCGHRCKRQYDAWCLSNNKEAKNMTNNNNNPQQDKEDMTNFNIKNWLLQNFYDVKVTWWYNNEKPAEISCGQWEEAADLLHLAADPERLKAHLEPHVERVVVKGLDSLDEWQTILTITQVKRWFRKGPHWQVTKEECAAPWWSWVENNTNNKENGVNNDKTDQTSWFKKLWAKIRNFLIKSVLMITYGGFSIVLAAWCASMLGTTLIEHLISIVLYGLIWYCLLAFGLMAMVPFWVWCTLGTVWALRFIWFMAFDMGPDMKRFCADTYQAQM